MPRRQIFFFEQFITGFFTNNLHGIFYRSHEHGRIQIQRLQLANEKPDKKRQRNQEKKTVSPINKMAAKLRFIFFFSERYFICPLNSA